MTQRKAHDKELEVVVQRALRLRITIRELCEYTGVDSVKLWHWRYNRSAKFDERQAFLDAADQLCHERLQEYMGAWDTEESA